MTISSPFYGKVLHNGFIDDPQQFTIISGRREAYEVLKVIGGIPLFFFEHIARLERTLQLAHADVHPLAPDLYIDAMRGLLEIQDVRDANVRISVFIDEKGHTDDWWMGFTPHSYPSREQYHEGVHVLSLNAQRSAPNAKLMQYNLRSLSESIQQEHEVYETILLEPNGEITEGSRSNIFFIKNGIILTAPDEKVLEGVTRAVVIQKIQELTLPFRYQALNIADLPECEAAFLSGTSRDVLPIRDFDRKPLDAAHPVIRQLQTAYADSVREHLAQEAITWLV